FPLQAEVADKFSVVRSLHHDTGDHFAAGHRMLTAKDLGVSGANTTQKFPGIGAIVNREVGARKAGIPGYVAVPYGMSIGLNPGYFGGDILGAQHNPFATGGDPNAGNFTVKNLNLAKGLTVESLDDRKTLLKHFDTMRTEHDNRGTARTMDNF